MDDEQIAKLSVTEIVELIKRLAEELEIRAMETAGQRTLDKSSAGRRDVTATRKRAALAPAQERRQIQWTQGHY